MTPPWPTVQSRSAARDSDLWEHLSQKQSLEKGRAS